MRNKRLTLAAALGCAALVACGSSNQIPCHVDTDCPGTSTCNTVGFCVTHAGAGGAGAAGGAGGTMTGMGGAVSSSTGTGAMPPGTGGGHMTWEINGQQVGQHDDAEGYFSPGPNGGFVTVYIPSHRDLQLTINNVAMHAAPFSFATCADFPSDVDLAIVTQSTDSWLPADWLAQDFSTGFTGCVLPPDTGLHFSLSITTLSTSHVTGSFDVTVQGGGPRAGSTLHVFGDFDKDLL